MANGGSLLDGMIWILNRKAWTFKQEEHNSKGMNSTRFQREEGSLIGEEGRLMEGSDMQAEKSILNLISEKDPPEAP